MIIKVYFLWKFWEWFLTKAHQSASGTWALMAKLAIQTLTDEYLNNTPLSLINPRGMLGEHGRSRQALASAGNSRGDIYFQLKWLGVLKMSQTTTLPKTVSRIAGLRSNILTFFFYIAPLNSQLFIYNRPVGARTLSIRCYASFWPKRR